METTPFRAATFPRARAIDILLLGDQLIFREGLRKLFEGEPSFAVVGDTADPDQAVKMIAVLRPDIVVVSLSGRSLSRALRKLRHVSADIHVRTILLTTTMEKTTVVQAQELGASGVLWKDTSPQVLFESVRAVAAGLCWLGRGPLNSLAEVQPRPDSIHKNSFGLTERELQVIRAVVRGDSNKMIASQLAIAQHTVKRHLANIFTKTGLFSRLQLAVFAMDHRLTADAASVPEFVPAMGPRSYPGAFRNDLDGARQLVSVASPGI